MFNRLVEPALRVEDPGEVVLGDRGIGIEFQRGVVMRHRLVIFFCLARAMPGRCASVPGGPEPKGFLILGNGFIQFALLIQRVPHKKMRFGKSRLVAQGRL